MQDVDQTFTIRLDSDLLAAIDRRAVDLDRPRSWVIRKILSDVLGKPDPVQSLGNGNHLFVPAKRNALRCDVCGVTKGRH